MLKTNSKSWHFLKVSLFFRGCDSDLSRRRSAKTLRCLCLAICVAALLAAFPLGGYAQSVVATVAAGANPGPMVLNPVTNRIYVASFQDNTVKVFDGATNNLVATLTVAGPGALAVNTTTNKIYVAGTNNNTVTVIDGLTNVVATPISVGTTPLALAVNPVSNKIYVGNQGSNDVSVIDGSSDTVILTLDTGNSPRAIGVNPVSNKVYVVNNVGSSVTVIDGAGVPQSVVATVAVGTNPLSIGVNSTTNLIYVANSGDNSVTVIDGFQNTTASNLTVATGTQPRVLSVNPVSNKIYVANRDSGDVTVIDGFQNTTKSSLTISVGLAPVTMALNPTTNEIYVTNQTNECGGATLSVIDGSLNSSAGVITVPFAEGAFPVALAVNPVTNQIYAADQGSNDMTVFAGATNRTATVTVGSSSQVNGTSIAANPATNKIYVPNSFSNTVTVIDGGTKGTTTISSGIGAIPNNVAINPVTNSIYVTNLADATVSVIDGSTDTVTAVVTVGFSSQVNRTSIAVNPVTNKVYVPNSFSNSVSVIDGTNNSVVAITKGIGVIPNSVAINPVTNKIYVTNLADATVSVIDGASDTVTAVVSTGSSSQVNGSSIAVNPATNKIYVPNSFSNTVTVIDGASNATTTISDMIGTIPNNLSVNPVTNTIYVTNLADATVSVIDGSTDTVSAVVTVGSSSQTNRTSIAANPVSNKIYVPNSFSNTVTVIDGATNTTTTVTPGTISNAVAINLATNNIYVTNLADATVTVISEEQVQAIPLNTAITPLPGNISNTSTPTFTFTPHVFLPTIALAATNGFLPSVSAQKLYFQLDTWEGPWIAAVTGVGIPRIVASPIAASPILATFTGLSPALRQGTHVVYAFATNGQESTSTGFAQQLIGQMAAEVFTVILPGSSISLGADNNPAAVGQNVIFTASIASESAGTLTGTATFFDGVTSLGSGTVDAGIATFSTVALALGSHPITAVYSGDANFGGSTSTVLTETIVASNPVPAATSLSPTSAAAGDAAFILTVNGSNFVAGSVVQWNGVDRTTTFVSSTQLTASIPMTDIAAPGAAAVTVFNPALGGGTSGALTFTINNPVPALTSISPTSALAGDPGFTLTLNGSNFVSGSLVMWNGAARTTAFVSSTQLTAAIPSNDLLLPGPAGVRVFSPLPGGGNSVNVVTFTITVPVPVLTTIAPNSAAAGSPAFTMTLTGTSFLSTSVARWNGTALTTTFLGATQLTALVPAADILSVGSASVTVFNPPRIAQGVKTKVRPQGAGPSGQPSNALTFTITATNPTPVAASLSPGSVVAGNAAFTLTVTGTNFVSGAIISWNGVALTTTFVGSTQLTAIVPVGDLAASGTASVTVFNPTPGGGTSGALTVTITAKVTTTTLTVSPTPPVAGQPITFTVTISPAPSGVTTGTVNIFDGIALLGTAAVNSSGMATFTASALTTGDHSVTAVFSGNASSATSTSAAVTVTVGGAPAYSVVAPATPFTLMPGGSVNITITVPPLGGPFNSSVTMSVSGLPPGATATFNPAAVTPGTIGASTVLRVQLPNAFASIPAAPGRPFPITPLIGFTLSLITLSLIRTSRLAYRRPRVFRLAFATVGLAGAVILFAGCNGGLSSGARTPAGTYVVVVTGTSGAQHVSTTVTLVVQ